MFGHAVLPTRRPQLHFLLPALRALLAATVALATRLGKQATLLALGRRPARLSAFERPFRPVAGATPLERHLRPLARRLRRQRLVQHLPRAILTTSVLAAAATLLARVFDLAGVAVVGVLAAVVTGAATAAAVARRPVGPFEAARHADAALALDERLATALELEERGLDGPLVARQVQDALAVAQRVSPSLAFPYFARDSHARQSALQFGGVSAAALSTAALLALWPSAGAQVVTPGADAELLALADPGRREEQLTRPLVPVQDANAPDGVGALTQRPDEIGELPPGLVGQEQRPSEAAQGQQSAGGPQQARQDAQEQQNPNAGERQEALRDLGNALRQSQTGKQAGEALRSGNTERASQQMAQMAEQVQSLTRGERETLAQSFQQAAQQIGDKDRVLADASRRAAEALQQFKSQDAQQAIRDAANQVRESGQMSEQQRALADRQQQMQSGGQPQLPQAQSDQAQQNQNTQGNQRGQASQSSRSTGGESSPADLAELEASLRGGGLQAGAGLGEGGGTAPGRGAEGAPQRLAVEGRTIQVEAEVREGPTQWRPPNPNAPPVPAAPPAAPLPGAEAPTFATGGGPDLNSVPRDLAAPVRDYFTPERTRP